MRPTNLAEAVCLSAILIGYQVARGVQETHSEKRIAPFLAAAYAASDAGNQPQANRALFQLAQVLQREDASWAGTTYGRTGTGYGKWLAWELCLTYGRLGRLASGTSEESRDFALAQPWCRTSKRRGVADAAQLRATLADIDDNEPGGRTLSQVPRSTDMTAEP